MEEASNLISELDVLTSFAHVSSTSVCKNTKPVMLPTAEDSEMQLSSCRHACLEAFNSDKCVANDCMMNK
jgi:DNA mismatch repair ATPase MutS